MTNSEITLTKAISEIHSILEKHDITGLCILHTPGFVKHVSKLDSSYSAMRFDKGAGTLKFQLHTAQEHEGNEEKAKFYNMATANMLNLISRHGLRQLVDLSKMSDEFDHLIGVHHSNEDQGNNYTNLN